MLEHFKDYAASLEQEDALPPMYATTAVRYHIVIDPRTFEGRIVTVSDGKGSKKDRGLPTATPHVLRSAGIKAKLLADNGEYVLGVGKAPIKDDAKVVRRHQAFVQLVEECAASTGLPEVIAVQRFLVRLPEHPVELPPDFDANEVLTFRVGADLPIHHPAVQAFWARRMGAADAEAVASGPTQQGSRLACMLCGEFRPIAVSHPKLIKGVPGGQSSGTAIVSANAPAFESYGLERSQVAPTCLSCAEAYAAGLNALLADERQRVYLGPLVVAFWTKAVLDVGVLLQAPTIDLVTFLTDPDGVMPAPPAAAHQVKSLLQGPRRGLAPARIDAEAFYAAALSGSGARVVFRDWLETTVGDVRAHLVSYFEAQAMVKSDGSKPGPLSLGTLASSLYRDPAKERVADVERALLSYALQGRHLPISLLQQAVRRNRAEQKVTHPRAALIKLLLSQEAITSEEDMTQLNPDHRSTAYQCGRLLAIIGQFQYAAQGKVNATITDRFYGATATAPGTTFPRLLAGLNHHRAKLRKERPGAAVALDRRLEEVLGHISDFPRLLNLQQQGLFALGFYHQQAQSRGEALAHKEAKTATTSEPIEA